MNLNLAKIKSFPSICPLTSFPHLAFYFFFPSFILFSSFFSFHVLLPSSWILFRAISSSFLLSSFWFLQYVSFFFLRCLFFFLSFLHLGELALASPESVSEYLDVLFPKLIEVSMRSSLMPLQKCALYSEKKVVQFCDLNYLDFCYYIFDYKSCPFHSLIMKYNILSTGLRWWIWLASMTISVIKIILIDLKIIFLHSIYWWNIDNWKNVFIYLLTYSWLLLY